MVKFVSYIHGARKGRVCVTANDRSVWLPSKLSSRPIISRGYKLASWSLGEHFEHTVVPLRPISNSISPTCPRHIYSVDARTYVR